MRKFIANAVWLIVAVPFYVLILLCTAWSVLVFTGIGQLFNKTEPYKWIDRVDEYVYDKAKSLLLP